MKKSVSSALLLLLALAFAGSAQARLGETEAQILARYGKVVRSENGATSRDVKRFYSHSSINIAVTFLDGKSSCEEYSKDNYPNSTLTDEEISQLLSANAKGLTWTKLDREENDQSYDQNWRLGEADKPVAVASSKFFSSKLIVATPEYVSYAAARKNDEKEKQSRPDPLKDF